MNPNTTSILWYRHDLRIADNPALHAAIRHGAPVIPVYIWAPDEEGDWAPGAASRYWLHHSLRSLDQSWRRRGSRLVLRSGPTLSTLRDIIRECNARALFFNRRYDPLVQDRDSKIIQTLAAQDVQVQSFNASLLHEPETVLNQQGRPYQVFSAFWRACSQRSLPDEPLPEPATIPVPDRWPRSQALAQLRLRPDIDWTSGIDKVWTAGERQARHDLTTFLDRAVSWYTDLRHRPDLPGTSRLSPHLRFGQISPRQIWHQVCDSAPSDDAEQFLRQLGWREFAHHLLFHFPQTTLKPLRGQFEHFPWNENPVMLKAWQHGRTGYPIVDAAMRQLWQTGWMPNRARMITASFLVKDLLVHWLHGARWFWDTLIDADLANNTLGWQWVAGCGADAAPYFRIFNPVLQGRKFDPEGTYVRRWAPELALLPTRWIHDPWNAPHEILQGAGVTIGDNYPEPIVDHAQARDQALEALEMVRD